MEPPSSFAVEKMAQQTYQAQNIRGVGAFIADDCRNKEREGAQCGTEENRATHVRPHSALADRTPAQFASLHAEAGTRFALRTVNTASDAPRQGFASPAAAALESARLLPEDTLYQSEALLRMAQARGSLLSLWSDFHARKTGSGGP